MRQKLNDNPIVQAAAIGVLALVVVVMFMMQMGGGGSEGGAEVVTPPEGTATTVVDGTAATTDPAATAPVDPATGAPADPAAASPTTAPAGETGTDFKAGPGLPASVANAYDSGQAVALLIVNKRGVDDRDLEAIVRSVGSRADVAVFSTDVKNVADYSRITEGVDLNRTPALIVMQPKRLTEGPMPSATVAYGFRGPASVEQAVDDALYDGPNDLPSYP